MEINNYRAIAVAINSLRYNPYLSDAEIQSYEIGLAKIRDYMAQQEQKSPCAACGYGGKHLDAPPCTNCPAYPKGEKKNEPLTLKELREMDGQPVYVAPQSGRGYVADAAGWAKVNARNERCEAPNLNFYFCEYVTYWLAYRHPPKGGGE